MSDWYDIVAGEDNLIGDELIGWEDIVGGSDDLSDALLGGAAQVPRIAANSRAAQLALALKAAQAKKLVRTRGPTKSRQYVLGFASASLAAAGTETITRRPQVPFKGRRITVADMSTGGPDAFTITDIRVGKNSQLVTTDAIPAAMFSAEAFGVDLDLDTCQVTMDFSIAVSNISSAAATFRAGVVGDAIE